jgi:hypothetical protein
MHLQYFQCAVCKERFVAHQDLLFVPAATATSASEAAGRQDNTDTTGPSDSAAASCPVLS